MMLSGEGGKAIIIPTEGRAGNKRRQGGQDQKQNQGSQQEVATESRQDKAGDSGGRSWRDFLRKRTVHSEKK